MLLILFSNSQNICSAPYGLTSFQPVSVWLKFNALLIYFLISIYLYGNHIADYITQKQPLGGLLFLLPRMISSENGDDMGRGDQTFEEKLMRNMLGELEQLLIHASIPVSETWITSITLLQVT